MSKQVILITGASVGMVKESARSPINPQCAIVDRAHDRDKLRYSLAKGGNMLIGTHRCNRTRTPTQDGRTLHRYCRRWKVERLFSWLFSWRRTVGRCEYQVENNLGFVQLASIMIRSPKVV